MSLTDQIRQAKTQTQLRMLLSLSCNFKYASPRTVRKWDKVAMKVRATLKD